MQREHYDVIIVGARLAGAATATFLASSGLRVLVLERTRTGTDTISTHALLRTGVFQLSRLGLLEQLESRTPHITETTFAYDGDAIKIPIVAQPGVPHLLAPRRTTLDSVLRAAAETAGATLRYGVSVVGLAKDLSGRVQGVFAKTDANSPPAFIGADLVVGADGVRSVVAQSLGGENLTWKRAKHKTATIYGYFKGTDAGYHWLFQTPKGDQPGRTSGIIPTENGSSCVFLGSTPEEFTTIHRPSPLRSLATALADMGHERMPQLSLNEAGRLRYFPGMRGYMRKCSGPGWALVGDAGYFKDPATAHGISDALRDAELLARALLTGRQEELLNYEAERNELSVRFFELSDEVASLKLQGDELRSVHKQLSREMQKELVRLETYQPLRVAKHAA